MKISLLAGVKDFPTVGAGVLPSQFMHQLHVCPQTHLKKKDFFPQFAKLDFLPNITLFRNSLLQISQVDLSLPPWFPMWRFKALGSLHSSPQMLHESREGPLLPLLLFLPIQRKAFLAKLLALNRCILVRCCISWSQSGRTSPQVEKTQVRGEQETCSVLSCSPLHTVSHGLQVRRLSRSCLRGREIPSQARICELKDFGLSDSTPLALSTT